MNSTGFFTIDFQQVGYQEDNDKKVISSGIGTYTNYARVGLTTVVTATGGIGNTMAVPVNRIPTIGIGMTVSGSNISGVPTVEGYNRTTGVVTLEPSSGITSSISGTLSGSNNITFSRTFGDSVSSSFETQVMLAFEKYRIRVRYFHPQVLDNDTVLDNQIRSLNKSVTMESFNTTVMI